MRLQFIFLLILFSCAKEIQLPLENAGGFGGRVAPLDGIVFQDDKSVSLVSRAYATICDDTVYARMYAVKSDGTLEESPYASTTVRGGRYTFHDSLLPNFEGTKVSYQIVVEGCDQYLSRPVTNNDSQQDVTWGSSLLGLIPFAYLNKPLTDADRTEIQSLITELNSNTVMNNYTGLIASTDLSGKFLSMFADPATKLLQARPHVSAITIPTIISEGLPASFSLRASHFDPSYDIAYEWHLDGVESALTSAWTHTPAADSSGSRTVTLFVGKDNGSSRVDRTIPFFTVTKTIQVMNTLPAQPLSFTVASSAANSTSVALSLATGAGLGNCSSFSHFLITQSTSAPTSTDPGFTGTCTTAPAQPESVTLIGADGVKTLSLWVRDSQGLVSTSPTTRSITLDRVDPLVSVSGVSSKYKGGSTLSFNYAASDATSGLASLELYFSFAGGPFAKIKDLSLTGTSNSMTLPTADVTDAVIRIDAIDSAGNTTSVSTAAFEIDSTAPAASTIARTSSAITNNPSITLSATCTGITDLIVGEAVTGAETSGWTTCATALTYTLSGTTQGTRTIKVFARDDVGNVSSVSTESLTYDTTSPVASITANPALNSSETSFAFQFSGTDNVSAPASLTFTCSLNGASFASCSSPSATSSFVTGSNNFRVRATDEAGNTSAITTYTWNFDASVPTLLLSNVSSLSPALSNSLAARSVTFGGTSIQSYKYTVIRSGACTAVDYSALSETTFSGNETVSFTPTTDGTYQVCAIGKTIYGVWQLASAPSTSSVLTIDTVNPALTGLALSPGAFGTVTTPAVTGTTENSSTVTLHLNSATCASSAVATTTAHATTGAFSLTASALSTDAAYNYYVKSVEPSGNSTCSSALPYTLDRINPAVALTNFTGGQVVKGSQATDITWSASDSNIEASPITVEYSLNAGANWTQIATGVANTGTYSWNMPGFNSTTAMVRLTALDKAGNTATSTSSSVFTIDSSAPLLTLDSLTGGQILRAGSSQLIRWTATDSNTTGNWITLSYSANAGSSWTVITSTTNTGSYSWSVPSGVDSATYRIKVSATDRVGQTTEAVSTSNIIIDSTAPSVALTSFTGGQAILGNSYQTISWSASDANFGATPITLEISSNGGSTYSTIASSLPNTGSYSWQASVADGNDYRIRVTATDSAGLSSTSASGSNFVVSTQAPNLSQTLLSSPFYSKTASSVTFGGSCDDGYTITITGAQTTTATCSSGTWSWTTATESTDAARTYNFSQTNSVLTLTISATWVRDTIAPAITAVVLNNGNLQTPVPIVSAAVTTEAGISVRLANAATSSSSCQDLYADDNWLSQVSATTVHNHLLSSGDGLKKVCVWAKDSAENVSLITPGEGVLGVDAATITYASGNPPQVISFTVINDSGGMLQGTNSALQNDPLKITWSVSDVESLDNNPILLDYTLDGTNWIAVETGYGGLSGNPATYSATYYGLSAPSSNYFRVRIRAKDSAGNISSELMSPAFNSSPWSVFSGNTGRGVGSSARSTLVTRPQSIYRNFAMNPINGDVYFMDHGVGLKKVNGATGLVSLFLADGNYNMGSSGTISTSSRIWFYGARILFDNKGFLYIFTDNQYIVVNENSERVLRVNPTTLEYTTYLGKGTGNTTGTSPSDVFVMQTDGIAFDESNSLYFISSCNPGVRFARGGSGENTVLMKVTQNSDGSPGAVTRIAGNCTRGVPTSGVAAISNPFNNANDVPWAIAVAVINNGRYIYYADGLGGNFKIIDGVTYKSAINLYYGPMMYSAMSNTIYTGAGGIQYYTPSLSASDFGEVLTKTIPNTGTSNTCASDGSPASQNCSTFDGIVLSSGGKPFFIEGGDLALARLRYVDDNDNMQTLVGSQSFTGEGQLPSVAKGGFGGIYYKKSTDPLNLIYPEGLYFLERFGGVFGYFTPTTTVKVVGNQSGAYATYNTPLASNSSLGALQHQNLGALSALTFDRLGQPLMKTHYYYLTTLDATRSLRWWNSAITKHIYLAVEGDDPRNFSLYPFGGYQNLAIKDDLKVFIIGSHTDVNAIGSYSPNPRIQIFDFENNIVKNVMGNQPYGVTPQQLTVGSLKNSPLACHDSQCSIHYDQTSDRLYFSEISKLRYITNPEDPSQHTLVDIFDSARGTIQNFSISPNGKYIVYMAGGYMYCHAISAADNSAICNNNPSLHTNLGPPAGLSLIAFGQNQITWKDDTTLFVSTYQGEIYQYILYH